MDKNKILGLAIIGLIILAGIFYAIWIFFFNKGQLIVEGVPPFNVTLGDNNYTCLEQQCLYKLGAREYYYKISKDGYADQTGYMDVLRGKTVIVSYDAVFEAKTLTGVDYPKLSLPVGYSKFKDKLLDISLFHLIQDGYTLQKMPKKINNIFFSPSGGGAILFEDDGVTYYKTDTYTSRDLDMLVDAKAVAWNKNEDAVYSVAYDDASKKDALFRVNLSDRKSEKDVYFLRNVDKYSLSVSPQERYVALIDQTSDIQALYLIDREGKSRTNVFEGHSIQNGQWSRDGNYYIFEGRKLQDDAPSLWMLDTQNSNVEQLPFMAPVRLLSSAPDGKFYFVTTNNYSLSGDTRPYFSNFGDSEESLYVDDLLQSSQISLHLFNIEERETYLVLDLSDVIPAVPEKIEVNEEGGIVRMLLGDQYFDVKVGE